MHPSRSVNFPQIFADFPADTRRFCENLREKGHAKFLRLKQVLSSLTALVWTRCAWALKTTDTSEMCRSERL
jgi:hypothetical protein